MKTQDIKISKKLTMGFGAIVVIAVVIGYIGWNGMNSISYNRDKADDANRIVEYGLTARQIEKNYIIRKDIKYRDEADTLKADVDKTAADLIGKLKVQSHRDQVTQLAQLFAKWHKALVDYIELEQQKDEADQQMVATGRLVENEIAKMQTDQKQKLTDELTSGAGFVKTLDRLTKTEDINRLAELLQKARRAEKNFIIRQDPKYVDEVQKTLQSMLALSDDLKVRFTQKVNDDQADATIGSANDYKKAFESFLASSAQQKEKENLMVATARELQDSAMKLNEVQKQQAQEAQASAIKMVLILTLLAISIGGLLAYFITRMITRPIIEVSKVAGDIALGDLTSEITIRQKDEVGQLAESFRSMITALREKAQVATDIAKGKLDVKFDVASEKDVLGKAMITMITALREKAQVATDIAKGNLAVKIDIASEQDVLGKAMVEMVKNFNKAIQDSNQKVDFLYSIPTPVITMDKDFTIKFINPAGAKAVGRTQEDCLGKKCFSLFNTAHCNTSNCAVGRAMRESNVFTTDTVAKLPSGDLPIRYTGVPLKDEFGNIVGGLECVVAIPEEAKAVKEVVGIVQDALAGKLDTRGNPDNYEIPGFKNVIKGINDTLDAIVKPLNEVQKVLAAAAEKNLTNKVEGDYKGQLADLKNNVNQTIDSLGDALNQVAEAVEQVSSASGQISSGSQSLAEGANEQASALEEISSSLEEMSSMTKQNADNANQAKALSTSARESADKGNEAMKAMASAIGKIKASSDQTAKIVKTIDEIAFQTNLLALNAAVEAARAGEAGKGFAVVAEEVRNLAQRSAEAAKNTANMIEESVKNAEGGVRITEEVAKVLHEIAGGASKVNDLVAEIAAAVQEQAQGIEQVNTAVSQMDKVTQQNASNSEESASAAEELNSQAEDLKNMISEFRLSNGHVKSTATAHVKSEHGPHFEKPAGTEGLKNRIHELVTHDSKAGFGSRKPPKAVPTPAKDDNGHGLKKKQKPDELIPLDEGDFKEF